jgi:hypothetical protein
MKHMLFIIVAGVFLAASSSAYAFDITSDPDATMNHQQKLGPNVYSQRVWNRRTTSKAPTRITRATATIGTIDAGGDPNRGAVQHRGRDSGTAGKDRSNAGSPQDGTMAPQRKVK